MSTKLPQLAFSPADTAKIIGVSRATVYKMLDEGLLWFTRGPKRISKSTIDQWCNSREPVQLSAVKEDKR